MTSNDSYILSPYEQEGLAADNQSLVMVDVENVSMTFNIANQKINSIKEYFITAMKRELMFKEFKALVDISFQVNKGDVFGILGINGSGKSTLLKIVAGILKPSTGRVAVHGNIAPLIELGAGFDQELTARENIYLNGALLGYSRNFIDEHFEEIVRFAELENFLDMPLKNYSSGMVARVAFAIATVIVPDILIADEVLSVGDFMFQKKCENRIRELIEDHGTTVLLVSHSDAQIERLCNKAIWIDKGRIRMAGSASDVVELYRVLGGRSGSAGAEQKIIGTLHQSYDSSNGVVLEHVGLDRYSINRSVTKNRRKHMIEGRVIMASATQLKARLLATALSGHINAPIILSSSQDAVLANAEYLTDLDPKEIVIIDFPNEDNEARFEIESQVESLTGVTPTIIRSDDLFELSIKVMEYGNTVRRWTSPLIVEPADMVALTIAYPFLEEKTGPIVFAAQDGAKEDAAMKLKLKYPEAQPKVFNQQDDKNLKVLEGFYAPFSELQPVNAKIFSKHNSDDSARSIVVTTRYYGIALSALQVALEQDACLVVYENQDLDEVLRTLELIDTLRPIKQVTFVGHEGFFNATEKSLILNTAFNGISAEPD